MQEEVKVEDDTLVSSLMPSRITQRDLDSILAPLSTYGPLTAQQLLALSSCSDDPFTDESVVYRRLRGLCPQLGLVRSHHYHIDEPGRCRYFTITPQGHRLLYGPASLPARSWHMQKISLSREPHTYALSQFVVHTAVCTHQSGIQFGGFARENSVPLHAAGQEQYFDAAFQLTLANSLEYFFFVEIDNHTEAVSSDHFISFRKTLAFYDALQNHFATRFRLLWICTRRGPRIDHLQRVAAEVLGPDRTLVLFATLPDVLAVNDAVTAKNFTDHRGRSHALAEIAEGRYRMLAALSERPLTRRGIRVQNRAYRKAFTSKRSLDVHLQQLLALDWVKQVSQKGTVYYSPTEKGRVQIETAHAR